MKLLTFAIYDNATKIYAQPFYMVSRAAAIRAFEGACQDQTTQMFKHPADFYLFELGVYDDNEGTFENLHAPQRLAQALEYRHLDPRPMEQDQNVIDQYVQEETKKFNGKIKQA